MIFQLIKQFKLEREEKLKKMAKSLDSIHWNFEIRKVFNSESQNSGGTSEKEQLQ